jgi:transcription termination factor NusB
VTTYELRRAILRAHLQYERSLLPDVPYTKAINATVRLLRLRRELRSRIGA